MPKNSPYDSGIRPSTRISANVAAISDLQNQLEALQSAMATLTSQIQLTSVSIVENDDGVIFMQNDQPLVTILS